MARGVLLLVGMNKDPNQGEGDKKSGMRYDKHAEKFVAEGKVEDAAEKARLFVERHPDDARRAEQKAKRGPTTSWAAVDDLVKKGRTLFERLRHAVRARTKR